MTIYSVYNLTTQESKDFYSCAPAKKYMKELIKQGYEVEGNKTRIYSNGDFEPCGRIVLNGSNAVLMSGATKQTKANY